MRAAVLVLLASLFVAAGTAAAADGEPRKVLTAKDQTLAKSVVLKRADLGAGFTAQKHETDEPLPKGARCGALDESDLSVSGDANSSDFRLIAAGVFVTVGSSAHVYRTLREANASWARGTPKQTLACLGDIVRLSAAPSQTVKLVSSTRVSFPQLAPRTSAYRIVVTIASRSQPAVRAYVDAIVLQRGRVQSVLLLTSLVRPVNKTEAVALAGVMAGRMEKAAKPKGPVA